MTDKLFAALLEEKSAEYTDRLARKQKEYATEDRLHNFKVAAAFQQCTVPQALFGFLTKHLVSLSDMIRSGESYSDDIWDEKIGDSINYLFLLSLIFNPTF